MKHLLAFGGFADDSQSVLAAVYGLALVGVEYALNALLRACFELRVASLADAKNLPWGALYDPQFALLHDYSLAHSAGGI